MTIKNTFAIALTVAAVALTGCDKKKAHQAAQALGVEAKASKNVVKLSEKQSWIGECNTNVAGTLLSFVGVNEFKSTRVAYDFSANENVTRTTYVYSDSCQTLSFKKVESGTFSVGDQDITQAATLDITLKNLDVIPQTDAATELAKKGNYCGHSDWTKGEKTSITTESTDGSCFGAKGKRTAYDQVKVDGNKLTLAKDADVTKQEDRPKDVSSGTTYTSGSID